MVALRAVQTIDNEIHHYNQQRQELRDRLARLGELLNHGQAELHEKQQKLAGVEKFYREKDMELKAEIERATKAKNKLSSSMKQKDYLAAQKEIENLRRANTQKEEEILKLLEAIEEYRSGVRDDAEKLKALSDELAAEEAGSADRLAELDRCIAEIEARKSGLLEMIPRPVLSRYTRILLNRDGVAVVEVRDGTCMGCHLQIPPQSYIQLLRVEAIMNCPQCQRFIYAPETLAGSDRV